MQGRGLRFEVLDLSLGFLRVGVSSRFRSKFRIGGITFVILLVESGV